MRDFRHILQQNHGNRRAHEGMHRAEEGQRRASRKDYYKALGVEKSASARDIKRAFRKLALTLHPYVFALAMPFSIIPPRWHRDKVGEDERAAAEAQFREVAEAYEVLGNEGLCSSRTEVLDSLSCVRTASPLRCW